MKVKSKKAGPYEHVGEGLLRYVPTGKYYARIQVNLKDIRKSLKTTDYALARRRLRDLRDDLEQTGGASEQISIEQLCDRYLKTVQDQAKKTKAAKERAARAVKKDWPGGARVHISDVKHSQVASWLASCPAGPDTHNVRLDFIRAAFDLALRDRLIARSPVDGIKTKKRKKEKDPTPSVAEFNSIVSSIREQEASAHAEDSGDLVEFMALAGLGQAEIWPMVWKNIDWEREIITAFRKKTGISFPVPLYPAVRPLLERIRAERGSSATPDAKIFRVRDASAAIENACKRLNLPHYTPRSLRCLFITLALEHGATVKSVASWQGHSDGGKLVLQVYGQLTDKHSKEMSQKLTAQAWGR